MPRYLVQVLGPPAVTDTESGAAVDFPAGKTLALLTYLVLHPAPPSRSQLSYLLWGDSPRDRGLQSVRQGIWLIRHKFGEEALTGREGTTVARALLGSDVQLFREALGSGRIDIADSLWRGSFLERFAIAGASEWDRWAEEFRLHLEHEFGSALAAAAAADALGGEHESAVRRYGRAIQVEPFRLDHRLALVDLLLQLRRGPDAEQALDAARGALPEPEFATAFAEREAGLRNLLRNGALEPIAALSRPELVGRARELSDLIARWNLIRRGRTQRVVLHGRSGVGKTRLAEELAAVVEQDRGRVIVVRTTEPESSLPWATVSTLVRRLLVLPGASGISAGSDALLRRLVPSLARHAPSESTHAVTEPAALADAVTDLIGAVAFEAPLLIVLDDGQWIDAGSWALLSRLLTQIEAEPVLFLVTVRDGEVPPLVERALTRVRRGGTAFTIRLANLSRAETTELLAYTLGSDEAAAGGMGDRIYDVTRGNPLFLVETTKLLRDVGALRLLGERWVFDATRVPDPLPLPGNIQQLLRQRVEKLSPAAERIAHTLATRRGPQDIGSLQPPGTNPRAWADALAELVDHGVALRTDEGYVLAHEQLAAVVRSGPPGRSRRRWLLAAAAAVLVLAAAAAFLLLARAPLYGGGTIILHDAASIYHVQPPRRGSGEWRVRRTRTPVPPGAVFRVVRRTVAGNVRWGATVQPADASPYPIELTPASPRLLFRDSTDVEVQDIAPDGNQFLLTWDNPATAAYDLAVAVIARDEFEPRVIMQTAGTVQRTAWSPDGLSIAVATAGVRDSLYIVTQTGGRLREYELPISTFGWCLDGSMLVLSGSDEPRLSRLLPREDSTVVFPGIEVLDQPLECGPDSRSALLQTVQDGLAALSVVDLSTGGIRNLPDSLQHLRVAAWLPDTLPPIPQQLRLPATVRLAIGETYRPAADVRFSDGSVHPVRPALSSSDTRILAALPNGTAIGVRPGTARLTASFSGRLQAVTNVTVTTDEDPALLVRDDFRSLDTTRWLLAGWPHPAPVESAGRPVLHLGGDGNFMDGLILRQPLNAREGLTTEVEFSMALTRVDRQRIHLSFCQLRETADSAAVDVVFRRAASAELRYPPGELSEFTPDALLFDAFGAARDIPVAAALPSRGWTHLAIQVRPDGYTEAVVNRRVVAQSRLRLPDPGTARWHVCLFGASVDTRLLVRDLRVWRGVRY